VKAASRFQRPASRFQLPASSFPLPASSFPPHFGVHAFFGFRVADGPSLEPRQHTWRRRRAWRRAPGFGRRDGIVRLPQRRRRGAQRQGGTDSLVLEAAPTRRQRDRDAPELNVAEDRCFAAFDRDKRRLA
jgi:hypothetical protein